MKDLGPISRFLGMHFEVLNNQITIDQTVYLTSILKKYKMIDCKPRSTPCELKVSDQSTAISDLQLDPRKYREIVGSLIYATTCTRPDLSWAVNRLARNLAEPRKVDWAMLKQVLRYVKGTLGYKLVYLKADKLVLSGYSDSD